MAGNVILFIVEGETDETTLAPCIEKLLKQKKRQLRVKVVRGDLLTKYEMGTSQYEITKSNLRQKLQKFIEAVMNEAKPRLKVRDICEIFYLTDTDNCFQATTKHAENKKLCLLTLFHSLKTVSIHNQERQLTTVFMHTNLEYALYGNEAELNPEQKQQLAKIHGMRYYQNPVELYADLTAITHWGTYEEAYDQIKNTQERASNLNLLISDLLEI
ncbi:MAG: hypothetical protein ACRDD4_10170 [Culicoidibacterales bacterium]